MIPYTPAVKAALTVLCLASGVGMFGAALMAVASRRYRYAESDFPRRHDVTPVSSPSGADRRARGGAA